jgi:hypothetical protein
VHQGALSYLTAWRTTRALNRCAKTALEQPASWTSACNVRTISQYRAIACYTGVLEVVVFSVGSARDLRHRRAETVKARFVEMMVPYVGTSRKEVRIENAISKLNAFAYGQVALQGKACDLIFAHECDAGMGLSVDDEPFEHRGARGTTRDAVVRAH